ncbi:hypothetical protein Tco_0862959 [Tanacetum coccineum]
MSRREVSSGDEEDLGKDASKQGRRINDIDADEDFTVVNVQDDADNEMFDVDALNDEEVFVAEQEVANEKDDDGEITLAQALIEMKSTKPTVKGVVIQEPGKKPKDLKNKSFDSIQKMFNRAFKRVNTFVDFRTDLVEDEEEVVIDVVPLAVKSPSIVGWKIHKEGKEIYY